MKRKIININEELCNGCGNCITGCAEGALQLVAGTAKLVKEDFCDGLGACIGTCPTGALTIEDREAMPYDESATTEHLLKTQGRKAVVRMEQAQHNHYSGAITHGTHSGCPGAQVIDLEKTTIVNKKLNKDDKMELDSELRQWPVHFRLVPVGAPFFNNKELVMMSTCGPIAMADIHRRYLTDRSVIVGCPKLDDTTGYVAKLAAILSENTIPKVIVVRMQVPCCAGLTMIVTQSVQQSRQPDIIVEEHISGLDGKILNIRLLE